MTQNYSKIIEFKDTTISKEEASYFYRYYYFKALENQDKLQENFCLDTNFLLYDMSSFEEFFKQTGYALIGKIRLFPNTLTIDNNNETHYS